MSTFWDLLLHVHEVHFTLLQIAKILEELKLEFIGFSIPSFVKSAYEKMFPDDHSMTNLLNWHKFEQASPDRFLTMYQFWVRKKS